MVLIFHCSNKLLLWFQKIAFSLESEMPWISKVFLNHWSNFFSQKVRRNFKTKYQCSAEFCTCDTMHMLLTTQWIAEALSNHSPKEQPIDKSNYVLQRYVHTNYLLLNSTLLTYLFDWLTHTSLFRHIWVWGPI